MALRPTIFIGSSAEGELLANQLQLNLSRTCRPDVWSQGVVRVGSATLQSLVDASHRYDFAALLLTPDDVIEQHGETGFAPRDNVIFEAGLFVGALGPGRTFLVHCREDVLNLPSDLLGVTMATYDRPSPGDNLEAIMGPPATKIMNAIQHVESTGVGPNYLTAFSALAREVPRDELVRIITEASAPSDMRSPLSPVALRTLERELESRGHSRDRELTRDDLRPEIRKYNDIRETTIPGVSRTNRLEETLGEIEYKALRQKYPASLTAELLDGADGDRVAGLVLARVRPDKENFDAVLRIIETPRSNYEHAKAIETMIQMKKSDKLTDDQVRAARRVAEELLDKRVTLIVDGDPSRVVLVETLARELNR
ncbi:MAG TPA: TIR domain-containing protein [Mycobacteriales bacterium]|jgi:hypothetical protein